MITTRMFSMEDFVDMAPTNTTNRMSGNKMFGEMRAILMRKGVVAKQIIPAGLQAGNR